jgi:SAM-dependent methyltransferase
MSSNVGSALNEQAAYYRARAAEYDQWWLREGRYDRGPELNATWFEEAGSVRAALEEFRPAGHILELACGTGIWTQRLVPFADRLTALDASEEMLAINAERLHSPKVRYIQADLFAWQPSPGDRYDTVFFGFWLSHVPPERFAGFWRLVASCLLPGGRVFFVDSRRETTSTARDHVLAEAESSIQRRRLNDGREFQVYKIFYDPEELAFRLRTLGWDFTVSETEHYFLYGSGIRQQ